MTRERLRNLTSAELIVRLVADVMQLLNDDANRDLTVEEPVTRANR
jgi:hypothetical protein